MAGLRLVFMGTPEFALPALQKLIDRGEVLSAVVTQPDRAKGRGQQLAPPPVKLLAEGLGIPVLQPARVRGPEFIEVMRELRPDLIVVVAFGQILPKALLEIPRHGCINVHASLLPRYRGAAPINWCIINGESETGVTTMIMDSGLDTGTGNSHFDILNKCPRKSFRRDAGEKTRFFQRPAAAGNNIHSGDPRSLC